MMLAHWGFAMSIVGVAITSSQSIEEDVRMVPAQTQMLGQAQVRFEGINQVQGPNYESQQGQFLVTREDGSAISSYIRRNAATLPVATS